ncbi:small GTP-binding protein, putative [Trichomonas vaginalis G3]|uniref:Small GTP-binding protein, putative n=1 Tax=Trichomonas vaginalis (strain ATCC PRA-98 / G3) TaxID=412133 RepID=A2DMZ1_TRIV3|nr:GTPase protein [Trichomonas vaginalis G3]EAY18168.1 small GTP-binding protein, putative [Trichomonas vaginalis G3]KAI5491464.1 GTPase protein [Trichomonas vaginalis G3]|eukprot:XP_001579154.1 small GTP-binding protein [Trichomonas vaginalis G3]
MKRTQIPSSNRPILKTILVGNTGVGKTCLISSSFKNAFETKSNPTVAPSYNFTDIVNCDKVSVRLQIWDTAGQERYVSVSQLFFRDSDIAFVCFDSCDKESFDGINNWVSRVHDEVPSCKLFYVITKSDLHTPQEIDEMLEKVVNFLGPENREKIFVTSAKNRTGIDEIFLSAANSYTTPHPQATSKVNIDEKSEKSGCAC